MKPKILVTGGAGYIGSHTVGELFNSGYEPIIIDDFSNSEEFIIDRINQITGSPVKVYKGDTRDMDLLKKSIRKFTDSWNYSFCSQKSCR